jgi:hypothetical protein
MSRDAKGYYADLGVSASASIDDIKTVYRALAKIYHPDMNRDRAAVEKFKRITEAYEVLTDPAKRRAYDGAPHPQPRPEPAPQAQGAAAQPQIIAAVQCSVCGKATAQPRFLIFEQVVSVILVTHTQPKAGIYCSECAPKVALKASAMSAAFGWWGLPWGVIRTIGAIFTNAFGGKRKADVDEELLWHNAVAFMTQGKAELSVTLASELRSASNPEIRQRANGLVEHFERIGVRPGKLKSPWATHPGTVLAQLALGAIVPGVVIFLFAGGASGGYRSSYYPPSKPTYSSSSTTPASAALADLCVLRPTNGKVLTGRLPYTEYGHKLTIQNGASGDAIIKVRNAATGRTVVSFFAAQNRTAVLDGIPDGSYRVQFAYGDAMTADCKGFREPVASEFPGVQRFEAEMTRTQVITQELSYTLYAVRGGNVRTNSIPATSFSSD